jgi:tetratricopeptide (TPR) repeat protein
MLRLTRCALVALVFLGLTPAAVLAQAQGRLQATVVDEAGQPVPDVEITIVNDEIGYNQTAMTDKKGRFSLIFVDATRTYEYKFEKEGYRPTTTSFKVELGGNTRHEFTLPTKGATVAAEPTEEQPQQQSRNPAVNLFNAGVLAFQGGDESTAEAKFREAIDKDPSFVEPYSALAGLYLDRTEYDPAKAMADKVLELAPDNARSLRVLYDASRAEGDEAKAAELLDRLKAVDTGGTDTAIRVFNEGAEAARLGDLESARQRFEEALEVDPELAAAHAALATIHLAQKRYDDAVASADAALEIDPGRSDVLKVKYEAFRGLGQIDQAKKVFEEMVGSDPKGTARALFDRGVEMFNAGNAEGAKQAFEQAIVADPDHAKAHYMLGLCYVNTGDTAKAKTELGRFLELAPDDPEAGTAREMLEYVG